MAEEFIDTGFSSGLVTETLEKGKSKIGHQGTASPEEQAERGTAMATQGRKGCKCPRLNVTISPEADEYIRIMAAGTGMKYNRFLNQIILEHREQHMEAVEAAKKTIALARGEKYDE